MTTSISLELEAAEAALQRGDYGQCLSFLEALTNKHHLHSKEESAIRILMITAWMGQGEEEKAISTCRLLTQDKEPEIRQQARQLISILEAPNLPRPESWSIKIPNIDLDTKTGISHSGTKKQPKKDTTIFPPTGPTKAFDKNFFTLLIVILLTLTIYISM